MHAYTMQYNMQYNMLHMLSGKFQEARIYSTSSLTSPKYSLALGDYGELQLFHDNTRRNFFFYFFFQGCVLEEHERYPLDFLGQTHGALAQ